MPAVTCNNCRDIYLEDDVEPECFERRCLVFYDQLTKSDLRLLEVRNMLVNLSDLGLSNMVVREYGLTLQDLHTLSELETLIKSLAPAPPENNGGTQHG